MMLQTSSLACLMLAALAACHSVHAQGGSNLDMPQASGSITITTVSKLLRQAPAETTCPVGIEPGNPEYAAGKGKTSQGVSYGIPMMQVDKLAGVMNKDNVLFCLVAFGAQLNASDIPQGIKGCVPGTPRTPGGPPRGCYPYTDETTYTYGPASVSIIGSPDNKVGGLGVVPDANIYMYTLYPSTSPLIQPNGTQVVAGWKDCEAELDARKANKIPGTPELKMVVFTETYMQTDIELAGAYLQSLTSRRSDIMHVTAAWADYDADGNQIDGYPAAFPEMVAISSVNRKFESSQGPEPPVNYTDFSAPGDSILWATANDEYFFEQSTYYQRDNSIVVSPPLEGLQEDIWNSPPPGTVAGSAVGSVTAALVDCGLATNGSCAGAKGKICLIQRGGLPFADKMANCVKGGGIGAIFYARADQDPCQRLVAGFGGPTTTWPIALAASLLQGEALLAALKAGQVTTVKLNSPARGPFTEVPIQFSFNWQGDRSSNIYVAALMGAGALGALWSAHTTCTTSQVLAAVSATAKAKVDPSLSPDEIKALYGKGLLQVWDAHNYLLANPCKPTPIITITTTLSSKYNPRSEDSSAAADTVSGRHIYHRGWFKVTVYVKDPVTRNNIRNVRVSLALDPSSLAKCGAASATTRHFGKEGGAVFTCGRNKGAARALTITATSAPTAWYGAGKGSIIVIA